jgi:hypothetical protein
MPDPPGFRETGKLSGWLFPACDIAHDEAGVSMRVQHSIARRHMVGMAAAGGSLALG